MQPGTFGNLDPRATCLASGATSLTSNRDALGQPHWPQNDALDRDVAERIALGDVLQVSTPLGTVMPLGAVVASREAGPDSHPVRSALEAKALKVQGIHHVYVQFYANLSRLTTQNVVDSIKCQLFSKIRELSSAPQGLKELVERIQPVHHFLVSRDPSSPSVPKEALYKLISEVERVSSSTRSLFPEISRDLGQLSEVYKDLGRALDGGQLESLRSRHFALIYGLRIGFRYMDKETLRHILPMDEHYSVLRASGQTGMHAVNAYGGHHFKLIKQHDISPDYDEFPGIHYSVDLWRRLFTGEVGVPSTLIKLVCGGRGYVVMASQTIKGLPLDVVLRDYPEQIARITKKSFTQRFFDVIGTLPWDQKPDNFIVCVTEESEGRPLAVELVSIDDGESFVHPIFLSKDKHANQLKSAILLLPQMNEPLDPEIVKNFLALNLPKTVFEWLQDLVEQNRSYKEMTAKGYLNDQDLVDMQLPVRFLPETAIDLLTRMQSLQKILLKEPNLTARQIFEKLMPLSAAYYGAIQGKYPKDLLKAIKAVFQGAPDYEDIVDLKSKPGEGLLSYQRLLSQFNHAQEDYIVQRTLLPEELAERMLEWIDFAEYSFKEQQEILGVVGQMLLSRFNFTRCPALTDLFLFQLARNPGLKSLTLTECSGFSAAGLESIVFYQPYTHLKVCRCDQLEPKVLENLTSVLPNFHVKNQLVRIQSTLNRPSLKKQLTEDLKTIISKQIDHLLQDRWEDFKNAVKRNEVFWELFFVKLAKVCNKTELMEKLVVFQQIDLLELFLSKKLPVDTRNPQGETFLHLIAKKNQLEALGRLSCLASLVNQVDSYGRGPLFLAILYGHVDMVKRLVEMGADPNRSVSGMSPLWLAVEREVYLCTAYLYPLTKDACHLRYRDKNLLHHACLKRDIALVKRLIQDRPSALQEVTSIDKMSPLHLAILSGDESLFSLILEATSSVEMEDVEGKTPLAYAASLSSSHFCKKLVAKGASKSKVDGRGWTPAFHATKAGSLENVQLLAEGSLDRLDSEKNTLLHIATKHHQEKIVSWLCSQPVNIFAKNQMGYLPIHYAAMVGNFPLFELFVTKGCLIDQETENKRTPLMLALLSGRLDFIRRCQKDLKEKPNPFKPDDKGYTLLHLACTLRDPAFVDVVLREFSIEKLDLPTHGQKKLTPLHVAISCHNTEVVAFLLDRGADQNSQALQKKTPLILAAQLGYSDIFELLLKRGANPFLKTEEGKNVLFYTAIFSQLEMTKKLLMEFPALVHEKDVTGKIPLHDAMCQALPEEGRNELIDRQNQLVALLIRHGSDVNAKEDTPSSFTRSETEKQFNFTPLSYAAKWGRMDFVRLLVAFGAYVDVSQYHGRTPGDYARYRAEKAPDPKKNKTILEIADYLDAQLKEQLSQHKKERVAQATATWTVAQAQEHLAQIHELLKSQPGYPIKVISFIEQLRLDPGFKAAVEQAPLWKEVSPYLSKLSQETSLVVPAQKLDLQGDLPQEMWIKQLTGDSQGFRLQFLKIYRAFFSTEDFFSQLRVYVSKVTPKDTQERMIKEVAAILYTWLTTPALHCGERAHPAVVKEIGQFYTLFEKRLKKLAKKDKTFGSVVEAIGQKGGATRALSSAPYSPASSQIQPTYAEFVKKLDEAFSSPLQYNHLVEEMTYTFMALDREGFMGVSHLDITRPNSGVSRVTDFSQLPQTYQASVSPATSTLSSVTLASPIPEGTNLQQPHWPPAPAIDRTVAEGFALREVQKTATATAAGTKLETVHSTQPEEVLTSQPKPTLKDLSEASRCFINHAAILIFEGRDPKEREFRLSLFIDIGRLALLLGDYQLAMNVWLLVSKFQLIEAPFMPRSPKVQLHLQELAHAFSYALRFKSYRQHIDERRTPYLPSLQILLQDVGCCFEVNKPIIDGKLNMQLGSLVYKMVLQVEHQQERLKKWVIPSGQFQRLYALLLSPTLFANELQLGGRVASLPESEKKLLKRILMRG